VTQSRRHFFRRGFRNVGATPASDRSIVVAAGEAPARRNAMNRIVTLATAATGLAERVGNALRWLSPTVARLTVGVVFFQSGWGKLHDLDSVTSYFMELGIPHATFQARFASSAEFVCGGLLLLGLGTRFAVVPLIVTMCVAIRTAQWENVDGISSLVGLLEFSYIALLVWLATDGAGPLSVDRAIARITQPRADAPTMVASAVRRAMV
jgi:putative oxidoreductase